jgi:hypothetical protein
MLIVEILKCSFNYLNHRILDYMNCRQPSFQMVTIDVYFSLYIPNN